MVMRKWRDSAGREVCDLEFEGRYPDIFISRAAYHDDGCEVPEDELDWIAQNAADHGECLCAQCLEAA